MCLHWYLRLLGFFGSCAVLLSVVPAHAQVGYVGRTLSTPFFSITVSSDGLSVSEVRMTNHSCLGALTTFAAALAPGVAPIQTDSVGRRRFAAQGIPIPPNDRTLDIVGVLLDADGADGTDEQAVGGLSILIALGRCNSTWVASAEPDSDSDGWSNRGEINLGSNSNQAASTPEHRDIPSLLPLYVRSCDDLVDNDLDSAADTSDRGCAARELLVDFGSPFGLWMHRHGVGWSLVSSVSPEETSTGDFDGNHVEDLIVDFGAPHGIWLWMNLQTWVPLHGLSPARTATGDLDGNGRDELVIDFGSPYGLWIFANNATWAALHASSAQTLTIVDLDGGGRDDVVIDFGAHGLWRYMNNSSWEQLHALSAETISALEKE
jgi:hypothetical protein